MKEKNSKYDSPFDRTGRRIGLATTIAVHLLLLFVCFSSGMRYVYPPPQERGILIDFSEEEENKPIITTVGIEPKVQKVDTRRDVTLVQRSESPIAADAENHGTITTIAEEGDVETPEPPRPKPIERRALFSSNKHRKDTLAAEVADKASDKLEAGHTDGNTIVGNVNGEPSAKLKGRTIMGNLPRPGYSVEKAGTVVVKILVDQYGAVTNAIPGVKGTTVHDAVLWEAAKQAALKAKFNISSSAPAVQEGTISYIFTLK